MGIKDLGTKVEKPHADWETKLYNLATKVEELRADMDRLDKKSAYFTHYPITESPTSLLELEASMEEFIRASAEPLRPDAQYLDDFIQTMKEEVRTPAPASLHLTDVEHGSCRMWTCDHQLHGRKGDMSLYGSLTKMTRDEDVFLMRRGGMRCLKALHASVVHRGKNTPLVPPLSMSWNRRSHRGAGIRADKVDFWRKLMQEPAHRRKYRAPMALASSLLEAVGKGFLNRVVPPLHQVHFIFEWPEHGCQHGIFIDVVSACQSEAEMLLAAYSALELQGFNEAVTPIQIFLKVLPDNKAEPEYLPITDWH